MTAQLLLDFFQHFGSFPGAAIEKKLNGRFHVLVFVRRLLPGSGRPDHSPRQRRAAGDFQRHPQKDPCDHEDGHELFEQDLHLPNLPDMIFADNLLRLEHDLGFGIEFNALEALKRVDSQHDLMQVAVAREWQRAR